MKLRACDKPGELGEYVLWNNSIFGKWIFEIIAPWYNEAMSLLLASDFGVSIATSESSAYIIDTQQYS